MIEGRQTSRPLQELLDVSWAAWNGLRAAEQSVLCLRHEEHTLKEIADLKRITRQRVQQIEAEGLKRLKRRLARLRPDITGDALTDQTRSHPMVFLGPIRMELHEASLDRVKIVSCLRCLDFFQLHPRSFWWVRDKEDLLEKLSKLEYDEPISITEWKESVQESGLGLDFVQEAMEHGLLQLEEYEGYIIRSRHIRRDRPHVLLLMHGRLATREMAGRLEEPSIRAFAAYLSRQEIFVRLRPSGDWALASRAENRFETTTDVVLHIVSTEGPISRSELVKRTIEEFPVSKGRVDQCLSDYRLGVTPDGLIDLVERGAHAREESEPTRPDHISVNGGLIGIRRQVTKDTLRGSGIMESRWIAWSLGLHSTPMRKDFTNLETHQTLVVQRSGSNTQISSMREAVLEQGLGEGDVYIIILDTERGRWLIRTI
jgi:hypothetical protein